MTERICVCDSCYQASCWQGIFMCDNARKAGIVYKTKKELQQLNTGEHPSWWRVDIDHYTGA